MSNKITLKSQSPYFDDFDPAKDYVQVLFRPGYPVQARELTTLQSFIQEQVGRFGNHFFKKGIPVSGAELTVAKDVFEMVLTADGNTSYPASGAISQSTLSIIKNLENKVITNEAGTVKAIVLPSPSGIDANKFVGNIYIKYLTAQTFDSEGYIYANTTDNPTENQLVYSTYSQTTSASLASTNEGVYFADGYFIRAGQQSIVLSNTTHNATADIGFYIEEEIATQDEDITLYDNARGSTNEGAPGGHRLKYNLTLGFRNISSPPATNFFRIATYINGIKQEQDTEVSKELSRLLEILARRTNDESGSYTVTPFTQTIEAGDSDNSFNINLSTGKAYVKGWEIDKVAPTIFNIERGFSDTKLVSNYKAPVAGTTSLEITSITGVLPGSQSNAALDASNRLQLRDAGNNVIGVARAWAVKQSIKRSAVVNNLYLYDIRMFQVITTTDTSFSSALRTGNDVVSNKTRGYVFTDEGNAGVTNGVAIISGTGRLRANQTIKSVATGGSSTIATERKYALEEVTNITASNGFSATVTANSLSNENTTLAIELDKHIQTFKNGSTNIIDNDFEVLEYTGATSANIDISNGYYDSTRLDDQAEITKTLKFAYVKIANSSTRTANYGWEAVDKEISLYYPDVYRVYGVNETTGNTFETGKFKEIDISTPGVVPVGATLTGKTSGNQAIVVLQNANNKGVSSLSTSSVHHSVKTGTGSASKLEVIMTRGQQFTAGEILTAKAPSNENEYTFQIDYVSAVDATGTDITGNYLLDNGQRAEYYDVGRLLRKDNVPAPANEIVVFFSYFDCDPSTNHYYSVDSYATEDFIRIDPRYYGGVQEIKAKADDLGIDLRNTLDFRLRVKTVSSIGNSPFNFANRDFENQDRVVPDTTFTSDFYQYLGRIDLISLQYTGKFRVTSGVPSENPVEPNVSVDSMAMLYIDIPPAVRYPEYEINIRSVDNRRYTMRDIGEIEKKVNRLEEMVSLSLLESQALHDDVDGRTKSGFVVDDFSLDKNNSQSPGDETHPEYNATIDIIERTLVPGQTPGVPVEMNLQSTTGMSTFFDGFLLRQFKESAFSTQLEATTSQRINPFATWLFKADVTLTPDQQSWIIRDDNYFTSLFGNLKPFEGDAAAFRAFNRITTRSPGGRSTTRTEWIGTPSVGTRRSGNFRETFRTGASRTTTTTRFNQPRSTGEVTTTLTDRRLIQNPSDYWMRPETVTYKAENLKPDTTHNLFFGGKQIQTGLVSDNDGKLSGTFTIPGQTYKAGKQNLEIKDTGTGIESSGSFVFKSIGHHETYDNVATTATERVVSSRGSRTQVISRQRIFPPTPPWVDDDAGDPPNEPSGFDPIAQMFTLPMQTMTNKETSVITSIDLWFSFVDTRAVMNKVKVEIREVVNGYPGGGDKIIGQSAYQTIDPGAQVESITDAGAVNFKFLAPIVLRGGTEYAIVVKSPSDLMSTWVAELGEDLIGGNGIHTSQPNVGGYYGSFFISQNETTWEPEQNKDLTYRLYRAEFDIDVESKVTLANEAGNTDYFLGDIGAYSQGLAMETFENSYYVRVVHPNHGMHYNGAQVAISGVTQGTYNGIVDSDLNGTHDVYYPTMDTYLIKVPTRATRSSKINTGIWTTFATQDIVYDSITTNIRALKDDIDEINVKIDTTKTNSANYSVSGNKIVNNSIATPVVEDTIEYELDRIHDFSDPMIVRSLTNTKGNDLTITMNFLSGSQYTSPIIRTGDNLNPLVFRNLTGNLLTDSDIEGLTTRAVTDSDNDDTLLENASYYQAVQSELEHSAYVTNPVDLEIPADGFNIIFDADMAPSSSIEAAYKIREPGDSTPFDELEWQEFPYAQQITETNYGAFSSKEDFKQYRMKVETNFEFSSYKIRLRMRTENEAQIPKIRDLRIIADI